MSTQGAGEVLVFTRGDRLRKARERLGLDQGPFAEHIGVSRNTVSSYERDGTERVKPIVIRMWAMATGVDEHWLMHGEGPTPGGPKGEPSRAALDSPFLDTRRYRQLTAA